MDFQWNCWEKIQRTTSTAWRPREAIGRKTESSSIRHGLPRKRHDFFANRQGHESLGKHCYIPAEPSGLEKDNLIPAPSPPSPRLPRPFWHWLARQHRHDAFWGRFRLTVAVLTSLPFPMRSAVKQLFLVIGHLTTTVISCKLASSLLRNGAERSLSWGSAPEKPVSAVTDAGFSIFQEKNGVLCQVEADQSLRVGLTARLNKSLTTALHAGLPKKHRVDRGRKRRVRCVEQVCWLRVTTRKSLIREMANWSDAKPNIWHACLLNTVDSPTRQPQCSLHRVQPLPRKTNTTTTESASGSAKSYPPLANSDWRCFPQSHLAQNSRRNPRYKYCKT